jgi:hypothetical protein
LVGIAERKRAYDERRGTIEEKKRSLLTAERLKGIASTKTQLERDLVVAQNLHTTAEKREQTAKDTYTSVLSSGDISGAKVALSDWNKAHAKLQKLTNDYLTKVTQNINDVGKDIDRGVKIRDHYLGEKNAEKLKTDEGKEVLEGKIAESSGDVRAVEVTLREQRGKLRRLEGLQSTLQSSVPPPPPEQVEPDPAPAPVAQIPDLEDSVDVGAGKPTEEQLKSELSDIFNMYGTVKELLKVNINSNTQLNSTSVEKWINDYIESYPSKTKDELIKLAKAYRRSRANYLKTAPASQVEPPPVPAPAPAPPPPPPEPEPAANPPPPVGLGVSVEIEAPHDIPELEQQGKRSREELVNYFERKDVSYLEALGAQVLGDEGVLTWIEQYAKNINVLPTEATDVVIDISKEILNKKKGKAMYAELKDILRGKGDSMENLTDFENIDLAKDQDVKNWVTKFVEARIPDLPGKSRVGRMRGIKAAVLRELRELEEERTRSV